VSCNLAISRLRLINIRGETMNTNNTNSVMRPTFLTVADVAERLTVSVPTIWRWAREGAIPSPVKIGGATRWKLSDLEAFEASL